MSSRSGNPHANDAGGEGGRSSKTGKNEPILCCQCGRSVHGATWDLTVALYRDHEPACHAAWTARMDAWKRESGFISRFSQPAVSERAA